MSQRNQKPDLKPLLEERMQKLLPDEDDFKNYLKSLETEPPRAIRCNTLKISPEKLKSRLENKSWKIKQPFKDFPEIMIVEGKLAEEGEISVNAKSNSQQVRSSQKNLGVNNSSAEKPDEVGLGAGPIVSKANSNLWAGRAGKLSNKNKKLIPLSPGELGRSIEHILGYYYVQEIASMLPIIALKPKPGELILDLAAAPGSKTTQLAAKMENDGTIIANEVTLGRVKVLASNTERCGVTNTIITKKEGAALCRKLKEMNFKFDKILIDAPCSGEGTLRTSKMTYRMWNINTVKKLSRIQKDLVESALEILKEGGEIVYSTCTHAPEENESVLNFILEKEGKNVKIEKVNLPVKCRDGIKEWKGEKFNPEVKNSCRIYPQDNDTEGFFIAKIKKIK